MQGLKSPSIIRIETRQKNRNDEANVAQTSYNNKSKDKKNKRKNNYENLICWICNVKGHAVAQCPGATLEQKLDAYKNKNIKPPKSLTDQVNAAKVKDDNETKSSKRTQNIEITQTQGTQAATQNKNCNHQANVVTFECNNHYLINDEQDKEVHMTKENKVSC